MLEVEREPVPEVKPRDEAVAAVGEHGVLGLHDAVDLQQITPYNELGSQERKRRKKEAEENKARERDTHVQGELERARVVAQELGARAHNAVAEREDVVDGDAAGAVQGAGGLEEHGERACGRRTPVLRFRDDAHGIGVARARGLDERVGAALRALGLRKRGVVVSGAARTEAEELGADGRLGTRRRGGGGAL